MGCSLDESVRQGAALFRVRNRGRIVDDGSADQLSFGLTVNFHFLNFP